MMAQAKSRLRPPNPDYDSQSPQSTNSRAWVPSESLSLPARKKLKLDYRDREAITGRGVRRFKEENCQASSGSDLSASKWFDQANKNVPPNLHSATEYDNEPPFFMTTLEDYAPHKPVPSALENPFGTFPRSDSEKEDLRGVIDDLTVENKRLKQILRNKNGRHASSCQDEDKLFEVRVHGLAPEKKRELESLLKSFASTMHITAVQGCSSAITHISGQQSSEVSLSSVMAPNAKMLHTDSGYASHSNSGQTPAAASHDDRSGLPVSKSSKDRNIKTYLHDIPDSLLPQRPIVMTERSRMALVVRRLEALFTGKSAAPGDHSQSAQQQEVAQSAAKADRQEDLKNNKKRRAEGRREAHMLPHDSKVNLDALDREELPSEKTFQSRVKSGGSELSTPEDRGSTSSRQEPPDQRPTRPLDLDIHRAQVASENINYLCHLGLASPRLDFVNNQNESWIYLNLLIGMAQLHTINVTPSFIRKSIKKLSTKFELSEDGHRVRWKGGSDGTFSKDDEKMLENMKNPSDSAELGENGSSSKRSKTDSASNAVASATTSEEPGDGRQTKQLVSTSAALNMPLPFPATWTRPLSAFDYKPVVFKGRISDDIDMSYLNSTSSSGDTSEGGSNSLAHALTRSSLIQRHADEGLITFYNNPYFCSDLSGENVRVTMRASSIAPDSEILGIRVSLDKAEGPLRSHDGCYFTPQFAVRAIDTTNLQLPTMSLSPITNAGEEEAQPMEFPVSGLGGVTPRDNFALDVEVGRRRRIATSKPPHAIKRPFTGSLVVPQFEYRVLNISQIALRPSQLPAPSYIFFPSSSSSDAHDMGQSTRDSESDGSADELFPGPPTFLPHFSSKNWRNRETDPSYETDEDDDDGDDNDESVDMLEEIRAADPETIAAQEREYVINQPGGANILAGSLAATVGAGSSKGSSANSVGDYEEESESEMENDGP